MTELTIKPDTYVWHFILTRSPDGRDVERIATFAMEPAEYWRRGATDVATSVEASRRQWLRLVLRELGAGYDVRVEAERGFVRSLYPGAALPPAAVSA